MNVLKIQDLCKSYANGVQALNGVDLKISNGMFGLLGANGAGKSTLMRTLVGLQNPTSGSVHFNDIDIVEHPEEIRKVLGYLPQEFGVYPKISAQRLLDHLAILKGLSITERKEQVGALLHQTNLYQHRKKHVHTFSGGMKQRFGIAQALLGNPQLVIVDEPTAGLDPEERYRFLNLLSQVGENVVVILSTHIVEDIRDLCTSMAILSEGRVILHGNPENLLSKIKGRIWSKPIDKSEIEMYRSKYTFISSRLYSGRTIVKVYSESQPDSSFQPSVADLSDLYFYKTNHSYSTT